MTDIETISQPHRAATLIAHPLRPRVLAAAHQPISASELARQLGQPRQRINYHVRQLAGAGLLTPAAQQRKRNMVEQQYVASARAYVLTPEVVGEAAPSMELSHDTASAAHLVALCARAQNEVAQVMDSATAAGLRVRTMSVQNDLRFESAEQRAEFTHELMKAISDVVSRYTAAAGPPFRLVVGCYPVPAGT